MKKLKVLIGKAVVLTIASPLMPFVIMADIADRSRDWEWTLNICNTIERISVKLDDWAER